MGGPSGLESKSSRPHLKQLERLDHVGTFGKSCTCLTTLVAKPVGEGSHNGNSV